MLANSRARLEATIILQKSSRWAHYSLLIHSWPLAVRWGLVAVICTAYVAYFASLPSYPFQDFPNHLARGVVMSDLLFEHGARFGDTWSLNLQPVPYVLHDLALSTFIWLFGAQAGGALFVVCVLLSLPLALMFYLRALDLAPQARPAVFLIGLYLATDSFFLLAFMGFRLALALVLISFGLAHSLRRRWRSSVCCAYIAVLVVGYLTHLTATVFFAVILAVSSGIRIALRAGRLREEVYLWLPLGALLVVHATLLSSPHSAANPATYEFFWGTWDKKFHNLVFEFSRFGTHLDRPMLLLLLLCLLWPLRHHLHLKRVTQLPVLESLAIALAFMAVYFLLPQFYSDSAFVDVRALPVVMIMLVLGCLNLPGPASSGKDFAAPAVLTLVALLSLLNLAYLVRHIDKQATQLSQYRAVSAGIAAGSYVLPVYTQLKDGELRPLLHAAGYAVADRGAIIPYLFSGDRGDPMKYFRYRERPYWPEEDWYHVRQIWDSASERTYAVGGQNYSWRFQKVRQEAYWKPVELVPIDWNRVACRYDYLLVTLPMDSALIGVPTRLVRENGTAALLAVDRSACRPDRLAPSAVHLRSEH